MADIFILYDPADAALALEIADDLRRAGLRPVAVDLSSQSFLRDEMRAAHAAVFVLSARSIESTDAALAIEIARRRQLFVAIVPAHPFPWLFGLPNVPSWLSGLPSFERDALIRALSRSMSSRPSAEPFTGAQETTSSGLRLGELTHRRRQLVRKEYPHRSERKIKSLQAQLRVSEETPEIRLRLEQSMDREGSAIQEPDARRTYPELPPSLPQGGSHESTRGPARIFGRTEWMSSLGPWPTRLLGSALIVILISALLTHPWPEAVVSVWHKLLAFLKLGIVPPPAAAGITNEPVEVVDVSVFAPPTAPAGKWIFVQVFIHTPEQLSRAQTIATAIDSGTKLGAICTLLTRVERGQRLTVTLECAQLNCAEPSKVAVWQGNAQALSFRVRVPAGAPAGAEFFPVIRVSIEGVPVGFVEFSLKEGAVGAVDGTGRNARRYEYAFLSYASEDRREVLKFARALRAAKIDFFQDHISLEAGEEWQPRLYEEIDKSDVFFLFWSKHSAVSKWVIQEAEYAHGRATRIGLNVPHITPVRLDDAPRPTEPPWMRAIHFDDYFRKLIDREPS